MSKVKHSPVAVTGIGLLTANGADCAENWRRLAAGESGIAPITRFDVTELSTRFGGCVPDIFGKAQGIVDRHIAYAMHVAREAIDQSRISLDGAFGGPLFLAVPGAEHEWPQLVKLREEFQLADGAFADSSQFSRYPDSVYYGHSDPRVGLEVRRMLGCTGVPIITFTACASGASAIQFAVEAIRFGETERALAVGSEASLSPELITRFSLLSALSRRNDDPAGASRPFSKLRDGFVIAEGAAAMVLESVESARQRGAEILALVSGCGEAADTFHRTRSSPDGSSIIKCMQAAIDDAGLSPDDIGYINCHGTSTPENDKMEGKGIAALFGNRAHSLPISSNKSMIGHTLTAAGVVEAVISVKTILEQQLPPTINYEVPDPELNFDVVPEAGRKATVHHILSNSFGFGGQNVSLLLSDTSLL
jgi:3-oxoacyl-[acyl-carrier-protein] synthase II